MKKLLLLIVCLMIVGCSDKKIKNTSAKNTNKVKKAVIDGMEYTHVFYPKFRFIGRLVDTANNGSCTATLINFGDGYNGADHDGVLVTANHCITSTDPDDYVVRLPSDGCGGDYLQTCDDNEDCNGGLRTSTNLFTGVWNYCVKKDASDSTGQCHCYKNYEVTALVKGSGGLGDEDTDIGLVRIDDFDDTDIINGDLELPDAAEFSDAAITSSWPQDSAFIGEGLTSLFGRADPPDEVV